MKVFLFITALTFSIVSFGQSNISFFHMQNRMPQSSNLNAAYFPDAKVYVSLPAISGIDLSVSNSFGMNDILTKTGDSTLIDIDRFLSEQNKNPYFRVGLGLTDFMLGVRLGAKSHFSLFVNERIDATVYYPIDLFQFIWRGNGAYVGEQFVSDDFSYKFTAYRELGIGYAREFNIGGFNTNIGVRLKYLTGLLHSSTKDNIGLSILTSETDYSLQANFHDATIQSAGVSIKDEENFDPMYLLHNENKGYGIDLGANLQFSDKLSFGIAANDLGFIKWQEYAENINLNGASFHYEGLNLDDMDALADAFMDSLETIKFDTVVTSFKTSLNSQTFLTASYNTWKGGYAQASLGNYFSQGRVKSSFGVGLLQNVGNWFSFSTTASIMPQNGLDVGAGLMLKGLCFQLYTVADGILNTINIPETKSLNIKFGINFLFGKHKRPAPKGRQLPVTVPTPTPGESKTSEAMTEKSITEDTTAAEPVSEGSTTEDGGITENAEESADEAISEDAPTVAPVSSEEENNEER